MWKQVLSDVIAKTLAGFEERLEAFGPSLLAMIVILAVGLAVAAMMRLLLGAFLPRLGFDRFAGRSGLSEILARGGIKQPASAALAAVLAWAVLAVFVLLAIGALNLQIAMDLVSRAFSYLPQVLIASALLVLGVLVASFVRRSVLIAAVNAGLPKARFLAAGARTGLLILFAAMALEHLGVGRSVLLTSFTILFGGLTLAFALAFGLGGRHLAREVLERAARRASTSPAPDELRHL
jgi:mechanosensitive ion channel-like protein